MAASRSSRRSVIPGFRLTLSYTLLALALVVLVPISALLFRASTMQPALFWDAVTSDRALAAYRVTFGCALAAALVNACFGTLVAWVLTRYRFPGQRFLDALIDLPLALPTAVAGIALTTLYAKDGWIGALFAPFGVQISFTTLGITVALIFVGLPFVVRTVQPVIQDFEREVEEAAASLGASRAQTFCRVLLPQLFPAIIVGFALAFARGLGEYGSVIFIAGNIPKVSEIVPLLIVIKLEQYDYLGASALATVMLVISFILLLMMNIAQRAVQGRPEGEA